MNAKVRSKLKMANAALEFATNHAVTDGGFTFILGRLKQDVDAMNSLATKAKAGRTTEAAATARRLELRRTLTRQYLRRLYGIAVLAESSHPDVAGMFPRPLLRGPDRVVLDAARTMFATAVTQKDLFVSLGIGDTFFDDCSAALDEFDRATETGNGGRTDHVGSNAELEGLAAGCVSDVRLLNTFMQTAYKGNLEVLAGWASAKRIPIPSRDDVVVLPIAGAPVVDPVAKTA